MTGALRVDRPERHVPVFVFLPGGDVASPMYHIGISSLRAMLKEHHGVSSRQLVCRRGASTQEYLRALAQSKPTLIGFSVYDSNFPVTATVSRLVRERLPDLPMVFGGPTATFSAEHCLRSCDWIDSCVAGEAEYTLPELMEHYRLHGRQAPPTGILGVYYRENGEVRYAGDRPLAGAQGRGAASLDVLPSPYLSGILEARHKAGILTTRGCVHACTFCNCAAMSRFRVRRYSVGRVLSEIDVIARTAEDETQRLVDIFDDAFALDLQWGKEILRCIIAGDFGLRFTCLARADMVDEEFMELLHEAKVVHVGFGLESTDPQVLRLAGKVGGSPVQRDYRRELAYVEAVRDKVAMAARLGMETDVSIILGLPGETMESGQRTLDDVNRMACTTYTHNLLSIYPGTKLFETHERFGIALPGAEAGPPYVTKHAYPVRSLKFTSKSCTLLESMRLGLRLGRTIANIASGGRRFGDEASGIVSLLSWRDLIEHAWLVRGLIGPSGALVRLGGVEDKECDLRRDRYAYCAASLEYYAAARGPARLRDGGREMIQLDSLRKHIVNYYPTIFIAPYAAFGPRAEPFAGGTGEPWDLRIGTFFDAADTEKLFADIARGDSLRAAAAGIVATCDFLTDSCRWLAARCPGLRPAGVAVDENGEQRVCHSGPGFPLGREVAAMAETMRAAVEAAERRRGCAACGAQDRCSHCPFPGPLSEDEFCERSRDLAGAKAFISMGPLDHCLRGTNL
jgi:radical SAM superfamily enzyme YgiQ (UPF0313 family)